MPPSPRQTNFGAGELDPLLWGRTDLPIYGRGARQMRNFFPSEKGAAVSRPGSTHVVGAKFVDAPQLGDRDGGQCRLIRFDAGDALYNAYALEFGAGYIRFLVGNAQVLGGTGNPYEVATPYSNTDIWQLQTAQLGDVMIIASPNHAPKQLRRNGHTDWTFENLSFKAFEPHATDVGAPLDVTTGFAIVVPEAWNAGNAYLVGAVVERNGNIYECRVANGPAGPDPATGLPTWLFIGVANEADPDHIAEEWQWMWTAIVKDNETGTLYETLGEMVTHQFDGFDYDATEELLSSDKWSVSKDMPIILRRAETAGLISPPTGYDTYVVQEYLLYRGRGGCFGWVGSTKSREFVDVGEEPNYAIQPPAGSEPFKSNGTAGDTGWPRAVAFFGSRLVFGGPTLDGGRVIGSKVEDFLNWDVRSYKHVATEAVRFRVAHQRREDVVSMVAAGRLVMLTGSSAWSASFIPPAFEGQPVGFDPLQADEVGATTLPPLRVRNTVLYARAKGRGVMALVPTGNAEEPYAAVDVSWQSQHLFTGEDKDLVDWCYQKDPWGVVWAVRRDGVALALTMLSPDRYGWSRFETDGKIESICSIPEGEEDAVYMVVVRMSGDGLSHRYIERMTSRVRWDGPIISGHDLERPADFICLDSALEYFGPAVQVIAGLEHLEGKKVHVIGPDMDPLGGEDGFTVDGGEIDLGDVPEANVNTDLGPRLLCYVGLAFTAELESLDIAGGDSRLRRKAVERIGFEVDNAIGAKVGPNLDNLDEWVQREAEDGYGAVSAATELVDMPVPSEWDQSARVVLQQSMPLPMTVVGLTRELAIGD